MTEAQVATRPMIEIEGLHKHFGPLHVLRGIDLSVAVGEVVCIIGPSGSGKSTLLRCINHLEVPEQGRIRIDGELVYRDEIEGRFRAHSNRAIAAVRAQVGMVFQHFNLFPHLSVVGNIIEAPVHVLRKPKKDAGRRALELLPAREFLRIGLGLVGEADLRQQLERPAARVLLRLAQDMHRRLDEVADDAQMRE